MDIYAHRGSTVLAPENTAMAFDQALAFGADVLEIDVRLSRDNVVMVIHDATVNRTCDRQGAVRDLTHRQLKQLNAGYHFVDQRGCAARSRGVRLLSLEEMFEQYPGVRINIDIKDNFEQAADALAATIEKADAHGRVNVGSFHAGSIHRFRQICPGVSTAAGIREVASLYFGRWACKALRYQYLQIPLSHFGLPLATRGFVKHAHKRSLQCVYWTINDESTMRDLFRLGVSGLVTDRPDIAANVRQQHLDDKRSAAQ